MCLKHHKASKCDNLAELPNVTPYTQKVTPYVASKSDLSVKWQTNQDSKCDCCTAVVSKCDWPAKLPNVTVSASKHTDKDIFQKWHDGSFQKGHSLMINH